MLLSDLLHALADRTALEPRPEAKATAEALRASAGTDFPAQPPSTLSPGILHAASLPGHPAARLILAAQQWLPWQDSPAASLQPDQLRAMKSVVTLLGPDGPIPSVTLLFGLFYQAPGSYYPLHAHNAAETYTVLAGSALWQAGNRRFPTTTGEPIHHPPEPPPRHARGSQRLPRPLALVRRHRVRELPDAARPRSLTTLALSCWDKYPGGPGAAPPGSAKGTACTFTPSATSTGTSVS